MPLSTGSSGAATPPMVPAPDGSSSTVTCPVAPAPESQLGAAQVLSCVPWCQLPPPSTGCYTSTQCCWWHASYSTTLLHPGHHPRQRSNGVTMSASSLSPPSTRYPKRGGVSHSHSILAPPRWRAHHLWLMHRPLCALLQWSQMPASRRSIAHQW
jgi:hypothetical protein